mgnify:CR=1 FL=1
MLCFYQRKKVGIRKISPKNGNSWEPLANEIKMALKLNNYKNYANKIKNYLD